MVTTGRLLSAYDNWLNKRVYPLTSVIRSLGSLTDMGETICAEDEDDDQIDENASSAENSVNDGNEADEDDLPYTPTTSYSDFRDELFGVVGSPEREEFEMTSARYRRSMDIRHRLTGPLIVAFGRPIWHDKYGNAHSLGHIAYCWWNDLLEDGSIYNALDGLAFHYFDDAYVKPLGHGLGIIRRKIARKLWHNGNREGRLRT